jgi:lysophospholipase L1-like esterase
MKMKKSCAILLILLAGIHLSLTQRQIKWVAIGDSITYLNDHPDETGYRVQKGYLTRTTGQLPGITFVNKGFNGWTSIGIAEKIDELGIEKADVYTVFLGTNDWWSGKPVGDLSDYIDNTGVHTVCGAFRIIIHKLKTLNPRAKIILMTPMQRGDFVYFNDHKNNAFGSYKEKDGRLLSDVATAIIKIARHEKIPVVDIYYKSGITPENVVRFKRLKDPSTGVYKDFPYPEYCDISFDPANDEYPYPESAIDMTYDGLHPSDKGNEVIAKMLIKELKRVKIAD